MTSLESVRAECDALRAELEEAKKQARLGWERAAEKDRAYGEALRGRDEARAALEGAKQMARGWEEVYRTEHGLRRETGEKLDEARADVQRLRAEWQRDLDSCNAIIDRLKAENERLQRLLDHATQPNPGTSTLVMLMNEASAARAERDLLKSHYSPEAAAKLRAELASARAENEWLRVACDGCADSEAKTGSAHYADCPVSVIQTERDEAQADVKRLRARVRSVDRSTAYEGAAFERDDELAEIEMLRGVGCREVKADEPESGPCGVCLRCAEERGAKWALEIALDPSKWPVSKWTPEEVCRDARERGEP
jgi:chromosome segregation ATPase